MKTRTKWLVGGLVALAIVLTAIGTGSNQTSVSSQSIAALPQATVIQYTELPAPQQTTVQPTQQTQLSNENYYVNSSGNVVHSPAYSANGTVPAGATAQCVDGTYSFSQHRRGTCSHHGGVVEWLQ